MGSMLDLHRPGPPSQSHESFLRRLSQLTRPFANAPQENDEVLSGPPPGFDDVLQGDNVSSAPVRAANSKVTYPGSLSRLTPPPNFQDAEEPEEFVPDCCCPPEASTGPLQRCCETETGGCFRSPHAALHAQAAAFAHLTAPPAPCTCCTGDIDALKRAFPRPPLEQPASSTSDHGEKNARVVWGRGEGGGPQTCGCMGADVPPHVQRELCAENRDTCPCKREKISVWTEKVEAIHATRSVGSGGHADIRKWVLPPPPTPSLSLLPPEPKVYCPALRSTAGLSVPPDVDMEDVTPQGSNSSVVLQTLRQRPRRSVTASVFKVTEPDPALELPLQPERPHGDGRQCLEKAGVEGRLVPLECVDPVKCKEDCVRATVPATFELTDVPVTSFLLLDKSACSIDVTNITSCSRLSTKTSQEIKSEIDSYIESLEKNKLLGSSTYDPKDANEAVLFTDLQASTPKENELPEIVLTSPILAERLLVLMGPSSSAIDIPKQASDFPLGDITIPPPPEEFSSMLPATNDGDPKLKKISSDSVIVNLCTVVPTLDKETRFNLALSDSDEKILLHSKKEDNSNVLGKFIKYSPDTRGRLNFEELDAIELEYMDYIRGKENDRRNNSEGIEYTDELDTDKSEQEEPFVKKKRCTCKLNRENKLERASRQNENLALDLASDTKKNETNITCPLPSTETNITVISTSVIGLMDIIPAENKEICDTVSDTYSLNLMPPPPEYDDFEEKSEKISKSVEEELQSEICTSSGLNFEKPETALTISNTLIGISSDRTLTNTLSPKVSIDKSVQSMAHYNNTDVIKKVTGVQVTTDMKLVDVNNNSNGHQKTCKVDIGTCTQHLEMLADGRTVCYEDERHGSSVNEKNERGNQLIVEGADNQDGEKERSFALKSQDGVSPSSHAEWIPAQGTPETIKSESKLQLFIECDYEKSETEVYHAQFLSGLSDTSSEAVLFEETPTGETREVGKAAIVDGRVTEQPPPPHSEADCKEQASTQNVEHDICISERSIIQGVAPGGKFRYEVSPLYQKVKYKDVRNPSESNTTGLIYTEENVVDRSTSSYREVGEAKRINTLYMKEERIFIENDTSITMSDFGSLEQSNSSHSCCSENSSVFIPLTGRGMNTSLGSLVVSDNCNSDPVSEKVTQILPNLPLTEMNESDSLSQYSKLSGLNDVRLNVYIPQANDEEMKTTESCNEKYHDCYDFDGLDTLVELNNFYQISHSKYIKEHKKLWSDPSKQSLKSDTLNEECDLYHRKACNMAQADTVCLHEFIEKCPVLQLPECSKRITTESSVLNNVSEMIGKFAIEAPKVFTLDYWPQRFQDVVQCTQGAKQKISDLMKFVALYGLIQRHPHFMKCQPYSPVASSFSTVHKASTKFLSSAGRLFKEAVLCSLNEQKDNSQKELAACTSLINKYGKYESVLPIRLERKDIDIFKSSTRGMKPEEDNKELDENSNESRNISYADEDLDSIDTRDNDASHLVTSAAQLYSLENEGRPTLSADESDVGHSIQNESDSVSESTSVSYFSTSDVLVTCAYVDQLSLDGRRVVFQVNNDKEVRTFPPPAILRKHMMVSLDDDSDKTGKTLEDITIDTEKSSFPTKESLHTADTRWNKTLSQSNVFPPEKFKDIAMHLLKKHLERKTIEATPFLERDIASKIQHMKIMEVYPPMNSGGDLELSREVIELSPHDNLETDDETNLHSFVEEITESESLEGTEESPEETIELTPLTVRPSSKKDACEPKNAWNAISSTSRSSGSIMQTCSSIIDNQRNPEFARVMENPLPIEIELVKKVKSDILNMFRDNEEDKNVLTLELCSKNNKMSQEIIDVPISEKDKNLWKERTVNPIYLQDIKECHQYSSHNNPGVANVGIFSEIEPLYNLDSVVDDSSEMTQQKMPSRNTSCFQQSVNVNNHFNSSSYQVTSSNDLNINPNTVFITSDDSEKSIFNNPRIHEIVLKNVSGSFGSLLDPTDKLSSFVLNSLHKINEKSFKATVETREASTNDVTTAEMNIEQEISTRENETEREEVDVEVLAGAGVREEVVGEDTEREDDERRTQEDETEVREDEVDGGRDEVERNEIDSEGKRKDDDGTLLRVETAVEGVATERPDTCESALAVRISDEERGRLQKAERRLQMDAEQLKSNAERLKSEAARLKSDTKRLQSSLERLQVETQRENVTEREEMTRIVGAALEEQRRHNAAVAAALGVSEKDKSTLDRSCSELDAVTSELRADLQDLRQRLARKSQEMKMMHKQLEETDVGGSANSGVPYENSPSDCYAMLNSLLSLLSSISITVEESSEIALANLPPPPPPPPPLLLLAAMNHMTTETVHSSSPTQEESPWGTPLVSSTAINVVDEGTSTDTLDLLRDRDDRSFFEELLSILASQKSLDSIVLNKSKSQPVLRQLTQLQQNVELVEEQKKSTRPSKKTTQGEFLRRRSLSEEERPSHRREFEERLSPWEELADKSKEQVVPVVMDWNPRRLSTVFEEETGDENTPSREDIQCDESASQLDIVSKRQLLSASDTTGDSSIHMVRQITSENSSSVKKSESQQNQTLPKTVLDESKCRIPFVPVKQSKSALHQRSTRNDHLSDCIEAMPSGDNSNGHESKIRTKLGGYGETIPFLKNARKNLMTRPGIVPVIDELVIDSVRSQLRPTFDTQNDAEKIKTIRQHSKSNEVIEMLQRHRENCEGGTSDIYNKETGPNTSWLSHSCYKMFASLCNVNLLSKYFTDNKTHEVSNIESTTSLPAPCSLTTSEKHAPVARKGKTASRSHRKKRYTRSGSASSNNTAGGETVGKVVNARPAELRPLDPQSLLVRWPVVKDALGYEIFVNGELKQKVYSGTRDQAALLDLNLSKQVQVTIVARMSPGCDNELFYANATFTPPTEGAF